jgi:DNA primase
MSNEVGPQQIALLKQLQKEIVVVPDRDKAGLKLVEQALEQGWSVSMPEWPDEVKDINDAVKKFGKLYTMWAIASAIESNPLKIQLRMKKWIG